MTGIGHAGSRPGGSTESVSAVGIDASAIRAQVDRILVNPLFHHSKRSSGLLCYIVEKTLEGQHDALKERTIGIELFEKVPSYDTSLDAVVRVAAAEVRKRLNLYYSEPGHEQELRIEVPVRSYVAVFRLPEARPVPTDVLPAPKPRNAKYKYLYFVVPLGVVVLALGLWGIHQRLTPLPAIDKFWAPVLNSSGPVLICITSPPNADSSTAQPSNFPGSAQAGVPLYTFVNQRVNVAMTDVSAAYDLANYLRRKGKDFIIRPASGTSLSDLQSNPAILLGGFHNEWGTRLGTDLHFRFRRESEFGKRWIEDESHPAIRNWTVDLSAPYEQFGSDYAVISRVLEPSTGQWWIGIAGLTGVGTQAAHQMVIDPKAMAAISPGFPKDWERKNLQIVLAIKVVQGSPGAARMVAVYSW